MKVWNYIFISVALMIFLEFAGLPTSLTGLFSLIGFTITDGVITAFTFSRSTFWDVIFSETSAGILIGVAAAGIAIGTFAKGKAENWIILPLITTTFVLFMQTFYAIIQMSIAGYSGWVTAVVCFIFIPFTLGFAVALVEFFRGTD